MKVHALYGLIRDWVTQYYCHQLLGVFIFMGFLRCKSWWDVRFSLRWISMNPFFLGSMFNLLVFWTNKLDIGTWCWILAIDPLFAFAETTIHVYDWLQERVVSVTCTRTAPTLPASVESTFSAAQLAHVEVPNARELPGDFYTPPTVVTNVYFAAEGSSGGRLAHQGRETNQREQN